MQYRLTLLSFISLIALATGCSSEDSAIAGNEKTQAGATVGSPAILERVPADTPFLFGNLEPWPAEVTAIMLEEMGDWLDFAGRGKVDVEFEGVRVRSGDWQQALAAEFDGDLSAQNLRSKGIDTAGFGAFYGDGIRPTVRISVADGDALRAMVERVAARAGYSELLPIDHNGNTLYRFEDDDSDSPAVVLVLVEEDTLSATVSDIANEDQALAHLAATAISDNAADAGLLQSLNGIHGFSGFGSGFIDTGKMLAQVAATAVEHHDFAVDMQLDNPACMAQYEYFTDLIPRLSAGYQWVGEDRIETKMIAEMRDDLSNDLSDIQIELSGFNTDGSAPVTLAMGFNMIRARQVLSDYILRGDNSACDAIDNSDLIANLNRPLPPIISNMRGLQARLYDVSGLSDGNSNSVQGAVALEVENPRFLVNMAQAFVPQFANIEVPPDGSAVSLAGLDLPIDVTTPGFMAVGGSALGVAFGNDHVDLLESLVASNGEPAPLLYANYDADAFNQFTDREATGYAELVQRTEVTVSLDGQGLQIEQVMNLNRR